MRKTLIAASIVALLVVLYAAAGQWLAPRFVRDALVERAQRLGLALQIGEVRTDPFALRVTLADVGLAAGGRELAGARRLSADLAWSSLWGDAWQVQQATLLEPRLEVVRGEDGSLRWPVAASQSHAASRGAPPPIVVQDLRVEEGLVHFLDRSAETALEELRLEAISLRAGGLSTLKGDPGHYELSARIGAGGTLSSQGKVSLAPLSAQGRLGVAALPLGALLEEGRGQLHGSAQYAYDGDRLVLRDVSLEGARLEHSGIEIASVVLRSPRIALPPGKAPFEVSGKAALAPAGALSASGQLALQPLSADLQVQLAGLPLPPAGRFLPESLPVTLASGSASASGRLRVQPERSSFEGAVSVRDARFEERGSGQLLLAWQELATDEAALSFAPFRAELGEVVARAPSGRLVIEEDGTLNFGRLFQGNTPAQSHEPLELSIRRLRIDDGTLDFADRSLENDFAVTVRQLEGSVTGFGTEAGNPARVRLEGRVAQYGSARIRGTIDLDAPKSLANIVAELRNVPLAELTPYIVKFAGYRVESGRVSAELRYRVRDARLVGRNQLTFEELQLGERVRRAGAAELPLELAVALLADAKGRIQLDIPVSGNLNDPQFDFGGLVARALRNVLGKIVSAPFRALASVFGKGGEDLDQVAFEPGAARLTPPAEETVAQVAKALAARPRLAVTVQGGYDPQRDLQALRRQTVRRHIAQRAGVDPGVPLDFGDPEVLQAAERLYLERAGSRPQLLELRAAAGAQYGRALVEQLAAAAPAAEGAAETLARARAETVRAALLVHGLDPSRVSLEPPAKREAGKQGVPTELALDTARGAAAGASR